MTTKLALAVLATLIACASVAGSPWPVLGRELAEGLDLGPAGELYDPELVRDFDFTFTSPDWERQLSAVGDVGNVRAQLRVGAEELEDVGVRYKGLSSTFVQSRKKPLNLSTDSFVPGQRLLGYDTVNLNNGYSDPSFVREALTTEMLRPYMPAQQTSFAAVDVNGEHLGLYLAAEQVEGTFVSEWFPGGDGILIKADPPAGPGMGARTFHSALEWEGEDASAYEPLYEVKSDGMEGAGLAAIVHAARVLDAPVLEGGTADGDVATAVPEVLDVDRALWYLAANNLFVNYDSYYFGHNYYLYLAPEDGLLHMLLWDTSLSFGGLELGSWDGDGQGPRVHPLALEDSDERPVVRRLLSVGEWRADYLAHYRILLASAFDPDALASRGAELQALARPRLETDPNRLFTLAEFDRNLYEEVRSRANMGPGGSSPGVVEFARERSEWLRSLPLLADPDQRLEEHTLQPAAPGHAEDALVTARFGGTDAVASASLVYRVDGGRPSTVTLTPDGGAWRAVIPGQRGGSSVAYYVRVETADGRSAFYPPANLTQSWAYDVAPPELPMAEPGDLVVNELQALNDSTVADEEGEYDDWVELHNRGDEAISLAGLYLSDDATDPWAFPLPDATLGAGEYLLVWCDNDPEQGPLHAPFALSGDGESLILSSDDAIVDQVDFGSQETDVSLARLPDGFGAWVACTTPTPGAANSCPDAPPTDEPSETPTDTPTGQPTGSVTSTAAASATATGTPNEPTAPPEEPHRLYLPALER